MMVFGMLGNALSIFIFFKNRKKDKASAQYLLILAVYDFMNLFIITCARIRSQFELSDFVGKIWCPTFFFFWQGAAFISSYIIILFSIERCAVIWFPIKMTPVLKSSKPRILGIFIVIVCGYISAVTQHWSELVALDPSKPAEKVCTTSADLKQWQVILDRTLTFGLSYALPCILICLVNVFIIIGLRQNVMLEKTKDTSKTEQKAVKNLLIISFFFVLTISPYTIVWLYYYAALEDVDNFGLSQQQLVTISDIGMFATCLTTFNYAMNHVFYTFSLAYYRQEAKRVMCCMVGKE